MLHVSFVCFMSFLLTVNHNVANTKNCSYKTLYSKIFYSVFYCEAVRYFYCKFIKHN